MRGKDGNFAKACDEDVGDDGESGGVRVDSTCGDHAGVPADEIERKRDAGGAAARAGTYSAGGFVGELRSDAFAGGVFL